MKKIFLLITAASVAFSCSSVGENEFILTGSVKGVADGKSIVLEKNDESVGFVPIDTVKIENGKFKFEGKTLEPWMHALTIEGVPGKSFVIIENGEINIDVAEKDSLFKNKVTGTYNNEQLTEFNAIGAKMQRKIRAFEKKNQAAIMQARTLRDTATMKKLQEDYKLLQKEMESNTFKYVEEHPKAFISALLIQSMFNTYDPDEPKIRKYYEALDADIKKTKVGTTILKKLNELKTVNVGRRAPQFSAPDPNGKMVSLKDAMGTLTIIDFWASWCGPCRKANPELVALYNEFHSRGLNIISVSLDKPGEEAKWKEAIAKDGMTWTHVSNLKEWDDPIAKMYGVESIPAMYILNEVGLVVAKDLSGKKLHAKVSQFLNGR